MRRAHCPFTICPHGSRRLRAPAGGWGPPATARFGTRAKRMPAHPPASRIFPSPTRSEGLGGGDHP